MLSNPPKLLIASTDLNDPDNIFEIANELSNKRIGKSFQRTIHSRQLLKELQDEISQKLKDPRLKQWIKQKLGDIARSERTRITAEYEKDLASTFSPVQNDIVEEIRINSKLGFIISECSCVIFSFTCFLQNDYGL